MPLDPSSKAFYGPDARTPWKTTRNVLMDELRRVLNDPEDDFRTSIGRPTTVTPSDELSRLLYDNSSDEAIIYVVRGTRQASPSGRTIDGTFYPGTRYVITFPLDFSMGAQAVDPDSPVDASEADQDLADALEYLILHRRDQFVALGLHDIDIEPDAESQRAGVGRNPHRISFIALTLHDYAPV